MFVVSADSAFSGCRYSTVGHLGPFEKPRFLADRVILNLSFAENPAMWSSLPKLEAVEGPQARV